MKGVDYTIEAKQIEYCLHSGKQGISHKEWSVVTNTDDAIVLEYWSPDGEGGFPGNVRVRVRYSLVDSVLTGESHGAGLCIEYDVTTDRTTPLSLTNHAYFNLDGHESRNLDRTGLIV